MPKAFEAAVVAIEQQCREAAMHLAARALTAVDRPPAATPSSLPATGGSVSMILLIAGVMVTI